MNSAGKKSFKRTRRRIGRLLYKYGSSNSALQTFAIGAICEKNTFKNSHHISRRYRRWNIDNPPIFCRFACIRINSPVKVVISIRFHLLLTCNITETATILYNNKVLGGARLPS